ncbi:hypothetical protein AAFF_G00158650 [Aldrovandia affinis]|uniref:G-protein coupled receptors family 1 profile domain-containing protein n=1 Tax=Aldrovandia affinis TaxID=143900 RepID=A0AAD7RNA1_9TELE|nr:hypothetical protein AAFF_G00158650 [Aldrovandia affinis]
MLWNATDDGTPENDTFSCYHPSVVGYRYVGVLWGCLVSAVGVSGNVLTMLAFVLDRRLRTRFNALIVNLALADLLYCGLLQPASVDSYLHLRWRGGASWCSVFGLLLFLSNSVSILTLCLIAAGRYLLIARRAVYRRLFSRLGLALMLPATWAVGLASLGPLWAAFGFVPQVCTCSFHRSRGRPYTTVLLFLYFFAGLGCVGLFYFLIHRQVRAAARSLVGYRPSRRSSRRRPAAEATTEGGGATTDGDSGARTQSCEISGEAAGEANGVTEGCGPPAAAAPDSCPTGASEASVPGREAVGHRGRGWTPDLSGATPGPAPNAPNPTAPAQARTPAATSSGGDDGEFTRVTRMCFAVFLCFVGCFAPFILLNIVDRRGSAPQAAHMFCANLTWLNSCINPVLYAAMNRQFGRAYRALLSRAVRPLTRLCSR